MPANSATSPDHLYQTFSYSRIPLMLLLVSWLELLIDTLNTWLLGGGSKAQKILIIFIAVLCIHCRSTGLGHLVIERIVYLGSSIAVGHLVIEALYFIGIHNTTF